MTCLMEGITTRIIGQTFNLTCSPDYARWLEHTRHNWLSIMPTCDPASQDSTSSHQTNTTISVPLSTPNSLSQMSRTSSDMVLNTVTPSQSSTTMAFNTASQSQISQTSSDMELSTEDSFINNHNRFRRARDTSPTGNTECPRPSQRLRVSYASSIQIGLDPSPSAPSRNLSLSIGAHVLDTRATPPPSSFPPTPLSPPT